MAKTAFISQDVAIIIIIIYIYIYIYIYIHIYIKWAIVVENDPKAPFSGLLHFTIDMYLIGLNVKQGDIKYHFFEFLVRLNLGWNPGLLGHWQTH